MEHMRELKNTGVGEKLALQKKKGHGIFSPDASTAEDTH